MPAETPREKRMQLRLSDETIADIDEIASRFRLDRTNALRFAAAYANQNTRQPEAAERSELCDRVTLPGEPKPAKGARP